MENGNGFHTFTGRWFDYENLPANDICLDDIAHHLSQDSRFGGASRTMFSVVEHCLHCAEVYGTWQDWVPYGLDGLGITPDDQRIRLLLLLHDAHEAYTKDFPHDLKIVIQDITVMQAKIDDVLWPVFKIDPPTPAERVLMSCVDKAAMVAEARVLMPTAVYWKLKESYPDAPDVQSPAFGVDPVVAELTYKDAVLSLL